MPEQQAIVITGMRRVGKTTLLKHLFNNISSENKIYYNLENALIRQKFSQENYLNIKRNLENDGLNFQQKAYIFLDEIQFIPNIPSVIKYLYDEYDIKFVVTGSSSYYIKNHFTESLAGRKFIVDLYPLTFREFLVFKGIKKPEALSLEVSNPLKDRVTDFARLAAQKTKVQEEEYKDLYEEYMNFGGFPEVVLNKNIELKQEILRDILNSYFQIDVTTLADFEDIGKLRDLLILLTQRMGQKLNITNLARSLEVKRAKVYKYLELLQATYVIANIEQLSSVDNKVSTSGKLYFADTGLANVLAGVSEGSKFENSVYMNLVYDYDLSYFQTNSGGEIDFVLDKKIGLEVKETASPRDLANLKKRAEVAGLDEMFLVSRHYSKTDKVVFAWDL